MSLSISTYSNYELFTPSDMASPSSSTIDFGLTSPLPQSPLRSLYNVLTKTPLSSNHHISNRRSEGPCKASDTPYHYRPRMMEGLHMPRLADSILDMRLCSSPPPPSPSSLSLQTRSKLEPDACGEVYNLPCHVSMKDAIRRISAKTMVDLLDGHFEECFDELVIIDCRYPYEFAGGHIPGALNINTPDSIDRLLLENPVKGKHACLIFHCEFSSQRAPRMALHVRNFDRLLNSDRYPFLHYPEIYILDGGYKNFFDQFSVSSSSSSSALFNNLLLGSL